MNPVANILENLNNPNYFKDTTIKVVSSKVKNELETLPDELIQQLIVTLLEVKIDSENEEISTNAGRFLFGLALLNRIDINAIIIEEVFNKHVGDEKYDEIIVKILICNGAVFDLFKEDLYCEFNKVLIRYKNFDDIKKLFLSIIKSASEKFITYVLDDEIKDKMFKCLFHYNKLEVLNGKVLLIDSFINYINSHLYTTDFRATNYLIQSLIRLDRFVAVLLSDTQNYDLVLNIIHACKILCTKSFDAQELISSNFRQIPNIRDKARKYCIDKLQIKLTSDNVKWMRVLVFTEKKEY